MSTGTFTGTGSTAWVYGQEVTIAMKFAGTASVDVETKLSSGTVVKMATGVVADYLQVCDFAAIQPVRLTCTAHTNNVEWELAPGP